MPLGDPHVPADLATIYAQSGVTVFEIGVPCKRPFLDGDVISASMRRAADAGVDRPRAATLTAELRQRFPDQAMIWMSYPDAAEPQWPPLVVESGADGALLPVSAKSQRDARAALESRGLAFAHFLSSPPQADDVVEARAASGYVMVQSRPGCTGSGPPQADLAAQLAQLRASGITAPLAVGFGIDGPAAAHDAVAAGADAVIVGSALVAASLRGEQAVRELLGSLRSAIGHD